MFDAQGWGPAHFHDSLVGICPGEIAMRGVRIQIEKPKVIKELWRKEEAPSVYKKLLFLNAVANYDTSFEQATEMFQVPQPTAYEWIRKWNRDGYKGLLFKKDVAKGRPPKLGGEEIGGLEELLKEREFWRTSEVGDS
jgi:hypothetical protein